MSYVDMGLDFFVGLAGLLLRGDNLVCGGDRRVGAVGPGCCDVAAGFLPFILSYANTAAVHVGLSTLKSLPMTCDRLSIHSSFCPRVSA